MLPTNFGRAPLEELELLEEEELDDELCPEELEELELELCPEELDELEELELDAWPELELLEEEELDDEVCPEELDELELLTTPFTETETSVGRPVPLAQKPNEVDCPGAIEPS